MLFLKRLLILLTRPLRQRENRFVTDDGSVARFVFSKRQLLASGLPRPGAFEPEFHPGLRRYETSVCGLNGVDPNRLWYLGRTIRTIEGKSAIAALEVPVAAVIKAQLKCEAVPEPNYDEHGVVIGWNPEDKSRRVSAQQELAASVALHNVLSPPAS